MQAVQEAVLRKPTPLIPPAPLLLLLFLETVRLLGLGRQQQQYAAVVCSADGVSSKIDFAARQLTPRNDALSPICPDLADSQPRCGVGAPEGKER